MPITAGASYTAKHVLDLRDVRVNDMPAGADDGVHVVAYFGDTTGNGQYNSTDAVRALRVGLGQDGGLIAFQLLDPRIVADITGNGAITWICHFMGGVILQLRYA